MPRTTRVNNFFLGLMNYVALKGLTKHWCRWKELSKKKVAFIIILIVENFVISYIFKAKKVNERRGK